MKMFEVITRAGHVHVRPITATRVIPAAAGTGELIEFTNLDGRACYGLAREFYPTAAAAWRSVTPLPVGQSVRLKAEDVRGTVSAVHEHGIWHRVTLECGRTVDRMACELERTR
jgi:hypothetical protein